MAACCSLSSVAVLSFVLSIHRDCFAIADDGNTSVIPTVYSDCYPTMKDQQQFYSTDIVRGHIENYWIELPKESKMDEWQRQDLKFDFPFYGQIIKHFNTTFFGAEMLLMVLERDTFKTSVYIQPYSLWGFWLESDIYIDHSDDKFIVEWRNVFIANQTNEPFWVSVHNETISVTGPYQFQTIVYRNGTILFLYKEVPSYHLFDGRLPVLGSVISIIDADAEHSVIGHMEYQAVYVDAIHIRNDTVIKLTPLSNCDLARDSQTCGSHPFQFYCKECKIPDLYLHVCSNEAVRRLQQWFRTNCKHEIPDSCRTAKNKSSSGTVAIVVIIAVVVVLIFLLGGWTYYAYKHPNTPSGRWLTEHRPSQWLRLICNRKGSSTEDRDRTSHEPNDDESGY